MAAALDDCPKAALPLIMRNAERRSVNPEMRALGIRVVGAAGDPDTLEWLLGYAAKRTKLLGRMKLLPKSMEMLAALAGLSHGWNNDPRVKDVLESAQKSKDADVRAAAQPRRRPSG
jgi:hypothetical protein